MSYSDIEIRATMAGVLERWYRSVDRKQCSIRTGDRLFSITRSENSEVHIVQSKHSGELMQVFIYQGQEVNVGDLLCKISPCQHPAVLNSMCVACGERVVVAASTVSPLSLNGGQQLQVSKLEATKVQESKVSDLQRIKKIALILDLDHTLVHATEFVGAPQGLEDGVSVLLLEDKEEISRSAANSHPAVKHHLLAKRPYLDWFLQEANKICQMTIYTAGTRRYAEAVARIIDPTGKLFTGRMVSRSDIPNDKSGGLDKSLQRLFLGDTSMAVIIDDREDVWKGEQASQLLLVKPFHHFRGGKEVNNASGAISIAPGAAAVTVATPVIALSGPSPGELLQPSDNSAPRDDQLVRCLEILRTLHSQYYQTSLSSPEPPVPLPPCTPMAQLMTALRSQVLVGCVIAFSGIIPVNEKEPSSHPQWRLAISLGAQVSSNLTNRTTHLLALTPQTQKAAQALQQKNVWVLHPDWLFYCRWAMIKVVEQTFMLAALQPGQELPCPTLDATPLSQIAPCPTGSAEPRMKSGAIDSVSNGVKRGFAEMHGLDGDGREEGDSRSGGSGASEDRDEQDDEDDGFGADFEDLLDRKD